MLPLRPGIPERHPLDCRRNGTPPPFAAPDVATGFVIGKCHRRHRPKEFPDFPKGIGARVPKSLDVHIVMDNHAIHRTAAVGAWPTGRPHQHVRCTPTPTSGTDQVGRRFAKPARKQPQPGPHASAKQPEADIRAFIERHNQDPKPFRWMKSADDILGAIQSLLSQGQPSL